MTLSRFTQIFHVLFRGIPLHFLLRYTNVFPVNRINLCCGGQKIPDYWGVDVCSTADVIVNLAKSNLPFKTNSLETVVCTSGINYFSRDRAVKIIQETYRVLKSGGIARFSTQDLKLLAQRYINNDRDFFFQKLPNGKDRFEGDTLGDKFAAWFYGYKTAGGPCRYVYDYESLAAIFREAGFSIVERRDYLNSRLEHINLIDNRADQMFFLEAVK